MKSNSKLPQIVVIGAGFGGLSFCKSFPKGKAHITLVDRQNHHLFQPLLYQLATAGLTEADIAQPIRSIFQNRREDIDVLMEEVTKIDLEKKMVSFKARCCLPFDYLVLAFGGQTSYFGNSEWAKYATGLKSLDDALKIRRQLLMAYELAESETDKARKQELMTTVVVGAGPTGVELAGAFAELAHTVLNKDFTMIDPAMARVVLVQAGPRVLPTMPEDLSAKAEIQLKELGVEIMLNTRVKNLAANEVELLMMGENMTTKIRAGNIVWAAGVSANSLTKSLGADLDNAGRIKVTPFLTLPKNDNVYAIGDIVSLTDPKGQVVPGVSPAALQMGEYVAKSICKEIDSLNNLKDSKKTEKPNKPKKPFVYFDKGSMATIGRSRAVAVMGKLKMHGFIAWMAWLGVHLIFLVGMRNRLSVFFSWVYSYFTYKRGARIITGVSEAEQMMPQGLKTQNAMPEKILNT
jgi:NADH dehydrogenase